MLRDFALGLVGGSRSMLPMALLARRISSDGPDIADGGIVLDVLARRRTAVVLGLAAIGELIADMLPFTGSRTRPLPFVARVIIGGTAGAFQGLAEGRRSDRGALLGSLGALAGTLGGYWLRTSLLGRLPPLVAALTEDALAIGLGLWATSR
jgi:uncharacterized membrane protein